MEREKKKESNKHKRERNKSFLEMEIHLLKKNFIRMVFLACEAPNHQTRFLSCVCFFDFFYTFFTTLTNKSPLTNNYNILFCFILVSIDSKFSGRIFASVCV